MKNILYPSEIILAVLMLTLFACSHNPDQKETKETAGTIQSEPELIFHQIVDFPVIKDTAQFIHDLARAFKLEEYEQFINAKIQKINTYQKIKLYGSDKEYFLIEYDWIEGANCDYPWKCQMILNTEGKPVKILYGERFELVRIFKNQNPFLLITSVSARGNGGHLIYKITADTLENAYEGYYDYAVQTISGGSGISAFRPRELNIRFYDVNKDGYNDIVFSGEELMLGKYTKDSIWYDCEIINGKEVPYDVNNPGSIIPVKYIFLYDDKSGHFKAKENYLKDV